MFKGETCNSGSQCNLTIFVYAAIALPHYNNNNHNIGRTAQDSSSLSIIPWNKHKRRIVIMLLKLFYMTYQNFCHFTKYILKWKHMFL
jgi:hypothetical protein